MRRTKKILFLLMLFLLMLLFLLALSVSESGAEEKKETVQVAVTNQSNFMYRQEGSVKGYAAEYLQTIAGYANWNYEYIDMSFQEALKSLKEGSIDIVAGVQKTEDTEKNYDFSEDAMVTNDILLCSLAKNEEYAYNDFGNFQGMKIGVMKETDYNVPYEEYMEHKNADISSIEYDTPEQIKEALERGEIDASIRSSSSNNSEYKVIARIPSIDTYFATNPHNKEIKEKIDKAQYDIHLVNHYYELELERKYYNNILTSLVFNQDEKNYIMNNPKLKVVYNPNWYPLEYTNENGDFAGVFADIFRNVEEKTGLTFEYVPSETYTQALKECEDTVNIITSMSRDYQLERNWNLRQTDFILETQVAMIYSSEKSDVNRVALVRDAFLTKVIESKKKSKFEIHYFDNLEACFNAVKNGKADYAFANNYETNYYLMKPKYQLLYFRTISGFFEEISVAVSKDADDLLYTVMNKALCSISEDEIKEIFRSNTEKESTTSWLDFVYTKPVEVVLVTVFLIFVCAAMILLIIINHINKKENIALEKAYHAKSDFLSQLSHEIRTPMNAIIGMSELALDMENLPDEAKQYMSKISISSVHLLGLINDILDMSKIESKKITLNLEPFLVEDFIDEIKTIILGQMEEHKIQLIFNTQGITENCILIDKLRIRQIVLNILSNSLKFTQDGGKVECIFENVRIAPDKTKNKLIIRDNGLGMDKDFLPKLFEAFEQEKSENVTKYGGTGLGMPIVKNLVEIMGGSILVHSERGVGTEFIIEIDSLIATSVVKKEESQKERVFDFSGKRILLVEDQPLNLEIAQKLLCKKSFIVETAENGQIAVEKFSGSTKGYYDVIVMDIRMPVMNGLEATKNIRKDSHPDSKNIPIIAMTANAFDEDVEASKEAGMNAYLTKPIDTEKFYSILCDNIF